MNLKKGHPSTQKMSCGIDMQPQSTTTNNPFLCKVTPHNTATGSASAYQQHLLSMQQVLLEQLSISRRREEEAKSEVQLLQKCLQESLSESKGIMTDMDSMIKAYEKLESRHSKLNKIHKTAIKRHETAKQEWIVERDEMVNQIQEQQMEIKRLSLKAIDVNRQQRASRPTKEPQDVSETAYEPSISFTETDESIDTNSKTS